MHFALSQNNFSYITATSVALMRDSSLKSVLHSDVNMRNEEKR